MNFTVSTLLGYNRSQTDLSTDSDTDMQMLLKSLPHTPPKEQPEIKTGPAESRITREELERRSPFRKYFTVSSTGLHLVK